MVVRCETPPPPSSTTTWPSTDPDGGEQWVEVATVFPETPAKRRPKKKVMIILFLMVVYYKTHFRRVIMTNHNYTSDNLKRWKKYRRDACIKCVEAKQTKLHPSPPSSTFSTSVGLFLENNEDSQGAHFCVDKCDAVFEFSLLLHNV